MTIRTASISDVAGLTNLWTASGLVFDPLAARDELVAVLNLHPELVLVDEQDGELLASVLGTYDGRRGWVNRLCTHPAHRGQGRASALVAELERRLSARGCKKANLLIEPSNAEVAVFYSGRGYQADQLIFMERWLSPQQ